MLGWIITGFVIFVAIKGWLRFKAVIDCCGIGLANDYKKTKASKMAVPTYYCEDCDAEFSADDECCCPDAAFKH